MTVKLVKINKLNEIKLYENPQAPSADSTRKKPTRNVPLLLEHEDGRLIASKYWVYVEHNDELVYNIEKNTWVQGAEFYDIGKSHIKEIYVAVRV